MTWPAAGFISGLVLPAERGISANQHGCLLTSNPPWDGEGHVSSSSSPWVVRLSAYLHLSAGAGFSLHPSPSSLSLRLLNIPRSAPLTALKQNSIIVYQHYRGKKTLLLGCFQVYMMVLCYGIKIQSTWV